MAMRAVHDPLGGGAILVDKMIGSAFDVVREVQLNLDAVKYLATNMRAVTKAAELQAITFPERVVMVSGTTGALGSVVELDIPMEVTAANIRQSSPMIVTSTGDVYGESSGMFVASLVNGYLRLVLSPSAPVALGQAEIRWRLAYVG